MNILIVCNSYPTGKNPHNQIFIKNMKESLEKENEVNVSVCYNKIFDFWEGANKSKDIFSNIIKYTVFIFSIVYCLVKNKKKIDVLFPQAIVFPTVFASFIKKIYKIPMVCYVHGGDVNNYPCASSLYQSLMKNALRNCDSVIVNSKDMQQKVYNISQNKDIRIISPGVDTEVMKEFSSQKQLRKKYNLPQDKYVLLAAGNAIKRKGFDILLKAVTQFEESVLDNIYLLIITEGPERKKLQGFITTHNLNEQVQIIDKVDQIKLNEYYNTSDLFIFPSREEPLGLVGIEAMATGTLVIASNVGGIRDYIEDGKNGFLFEKENTSALAEKISYVLNQDENSLACIHENMKLVVESHSIKKSSQKLISLFGTLRLQKSLNK